MTSTGYADGLRTWQAAVVRLWSASDDAFATLSLFWLPEGTQGAPWMAALEHGDERWSQQLQVKTAPTLSEALQRLWKHVQPLRRLFDEGAEPSLFPDDLPEDAWLTAEEQSVLNQLRGILESRQPIALRLTYRPELGLSSRWMAALYDPRQESPRGTTLEMRGGELAEVCQLVIDAAGV
jgi:hypothetical protein